VQPAIGAAKRQRRGLDHDEIGVESIREVFQAFLLAQHLGDECLVRIGGGHLLRLTRRDQYHYPYDDDCGDLGVGMLPARRHAQLMLSVHTPVNPALLSFDPDREERRWKSARAIN
jgi:hypothetical protein